MDRHKSEPRLHLSDNSVRYSSMSYLDESNSLLLR